MGCCGDPPPIDYQAQAQAQGAANRETAIAQSNMNNPNMITPYGNQTYTGGADGTRGTLTQTLSPAEQAALDQRNDIRSNTLGILQGDMGNIRSALSGAFGLSGGPMMGLDPRFMPAPGDIQKDANLGAAGGIQSGLNFGGAPGMPVASDQTRQEVADAMYRQGSRYLDPQFAEAQDALTTKMANQGMTQGSVGAQRAQEAYDRSKMQAYGNLSDQSTQSGISAMNTLFGEQLAARQQGVGETTAQGQFANSAQQQAANQLLASQAARNAAATTGANIAGASTSAANQARQQAYTEYATNRTMPINMLSGLLSQGQINNPQFQATAPTTIAPPPIMQGAIAQGQNDAANTSSQNQLIGGLATAAGTFFGGPLGGAAAGAAAKGLTNSDRRLKSNIVQVGEMKNGLPLYEYDIDGRRTQGVMADEVHKVIPEAVSVDSRGFLQVDYSMLGD